MVGAAVLVLAAVIFIPMILAGSPPQRSGDAHSPGPGGAKDPLPSTADGSSSARGEAGFSSRIVPLAAPRSVSRTSAVEPVGKPENTQAEGKGVVVLPPIASQQPPMAPPEAKTSAQSAAKQVGVQKTLVAPAQQSATAGWVVQLGSFASARNAYALRDRLKAKGHKAFARSSGQGAEAVTRVYVGPDASREAAQERVSRLLGETRLQGIVIRYPES
jgi:DedD protein